MIMMDYGYWCILAFALFDTRMVHLGFGLVFLDTLRNCLATRYVCSPNDNDAIDEISVHQSSSYRNTLANRRKNTQSKMVSRILMQLSQNFSNWETVKADLRDPRYFPDTQGTSSRYDNPTASFQLLFSQFRPTSVHTRRTCNHFHPVHHHVYGSTY
jgi:hypothetical protein